MDVNGAWADLHRLVMNEPERRVGPQVASPTRSCILACPGRLNPGCGPCAATDGGLWVREPSAPHPGMQFRKDNGRIHRGCSDGQAVPDPLNMVRAVPQQSGPGLSIGTVPTPWHDLLSRLSCHVV